MNLLVFRFSAMGDVALTQPVIKHVLSLNRKVHITLVTKPQFEPLFAGLPRFTFLGVDFKKEYKGLRGLLRLHKKLMASEKYDYIIDLHDVVRTWVLCFLCSLKGVPTRRIDKGRTAKKNLTRKTKKIFKPLKHTTQRYLEVFSALGLTLEDIKIPSLHLAANNPGGSLAKILSSPRFTHKKIHWVGIAPFAKHPQKQWPIEKMQVLIRQMTEQKKILVLLFGGHDEANQLKGLAGDNDYVHNLAGKLSLAEEMEVIRQLDLMITMDSFNMHLAGLLGVKVISIWGATHPHAGFGPLGENQKLLVQIPHEALSCRPCSVFGNRPCWRGDFACMQQIAPETVMQKVKAVLKSP